MDLGHELLPAFEVLQAENAALKEQVGQLQTIIDEEAKDSGAVILERDALKNQVAQLERDVEFTADARVKDYKQFKETIAHQAEALRVKDEAMQHYMDYGVIESSYYKIRSALAIQPSPDILRERDARLVERIATTTMDYYPEQDILLGIADQIRKGTWK